MCSIVLYEHKRNRYLIFSLPRLIMNHILPEKRAFMQRTIDGLSVTIVRKSIKNMHLRVLSPNGEIQITAPNRLPVSQIDRFVREKRGWIEAQQRRLSARPAVTSLAFTDGQTVYLWGAAYTLRLEQAARGRSALQRGQEIILYVHPSDGVSQREALLNEFYRDALAKQIAARLPFWEARTGLHPSAWQIKNMKTRWGTCNTATKKIWLNLQLAKQPPVCLDYVIAHELTHLRYPGHGQDFKAFLTHVMPNWPEVRKALNNQTFV